MFFTVSPFLYLSPPLYKVTPINLQTNETVNGLYILISILEVGVEITLVEVTLKSPY